MKVAIILLAACVAVAVAAPTEKTADAENRAREDYVNQVNARRQAYVNRKAEAVGASSGTYREDGVPGVEPGYAYAYGAPVYPGYGYEVNGYPGYAYEGRNDYNDYNDYNGYNTYNGH